MNTLYKTYWAYRNKISNKLFGTVHMPAFGAKKGSILLSYLTEPFTLARGESFSNFHTMYWECYEIARLFSVRGYEVDAIEATNITFIPKKKYAVCVDADKNLFRFTSYLPKDCKKVHHILMMYWEEYNKAEQARLDYLEKRRGVRLLPRRKLSDSRNAEVADYLEGFGNKTIFETFKKFHKPIFFIPISTVLKFDFPLHKDFAAARKHFLWIGGGGAVIKGLDIALEAFATTPDLHLHVCGPIYSESDFVNEYKKELEQTPNIHVYGRLDVASEAFANIVDQCAAVVYPSAGEGSSGAIVQAMHAGLVPIITNETGIREDSGYIPLLDPTPQSVARAVRDFSNMPADTIRNKSHAIWKYARAVYTREEFSKAYGKFIDEVLKL